MQIYYDSQRAINELKAQRRDVYYSLGTTYKREFGIRIA